MKRKCRNVSNSSGKAKKECLITCKLLNLNFLCRKQTKKMKEEQWYANKKSHDGDYESKMNNIVRKLKRSQKVVEEKQKEFQHQMELKNEKRRLREYDLQVERERMRQLAEAKKDKIIQKEQKDLKNVKTQQFKQSIVREQLMNSRIQDLIKKDQFMETIQTVVQNDTNPKVRNKILQKNRLNLSISRIDLKNDNKGKSTL